MPTQPKHAPCSCGKPRSKPWHLACGDCWALVPAPLQTKVFTLFRTARGSDEHLAAVRECFAKIRDGRAAKNPTLELS